jgi:hypothetical protein
MGQTGWDLAFESALAVMAQEFGNWGRGRLSSDIVMIICE